MRYINGIMVTFGGDVNMVGWTTPENVIKRMENI